MSVTSISCFLADVYFTGGGGGLNGGGISSLRKKNNKRLADIKVNDMTHGLTSLSPFLDEVPPVKKSNQNQSKKNRNDDKHCM